ncbi:hypothetical protein [Candidatus Nitrososphaera sp. FF02]|uniref:hypothetical protein n=1 Tax=Candidatus Nitrososphaera sp. FF02 TaxID=3398226 RepID=UPI0039E9CD2A
MSKSEASIVDSKIFLALVDVMIDTARIRPILLDYSAGKNVAEICRNYKLKAPQLYRLLDHYEMPMRNERAAPRSIFTYKRRHKKDNETLEERQAQIKWVREFVPWFTKKTLEQVKDP